MEGYDTFVRDNNVEWSGEKIVFDDSHVKYGLNQTQERPVRFTPSSSYTVFRVRESNRYLVNVGICVSPKRRTVERKNSSR